MIAYLLALAVSAMGVGLVDARWRLALWRDPVRTAGLVALGAVFFLAWDLVGIALGVFRHVDSRWATGALVAPQLPIEEVVFVAFLSYLTLVLHSAACRILERRVLERRRPR